MKYSLHNWLLCLIAIFKFYVYLIEIIPSEILNNNNNV